MSKLRFYECNISAWENQFQSFLYALDCVEPIPEQCGYISSNRADLFKHVYDTHLRRKHSNSFAQLKRQLTKDQMAQLHDLLSYLTNSYELQLIDRTDHVWQLDQVSMLQKTQSGRIRNKDQPAATVCPPQESLFLE